jgi:hypothetical protein
MSRSQIELLVVDIGAARKRLVTALRRIESDQSLSKRTRASLSRPVKESLKRLDTVRDLIDSMSSGTETEGGDDPARRQNQEGRGRSHPDTANAEDRAVGSMPGGGGGWGDESTTGQTGGWDGDSSEGREP